MIGQTTHPNANSGGGSTPGDGTATWGQIAGTLSDQTDLNSRFQGVENKHVRTTRFAIISSGTSGSVAIPTNNTVILDDFGGTVDAVVCGASGGRPTFEAVKTAGGETVATTFDEAGNYSFSGAPASYPVCIIYRTRCTLKNFEDTASSIIGGIDVLTDKAFQEHIANTSNPHSVTKTQVGLGNVPNVNATDPANISNLPGYLRDKFSINIEGPVSANNLTTAINNISHSFAETGRSGFKRWTTNNASYWSWTPGNPGTFTLLQAGEGYIRGREITWAAGQTVQIAYDERVFLFINSSGVLGKSATNNLLDKEDRINLFIFQNDIEGQEICLRNEHQYILDIGSRNWIDAGFGLVITSTPNAAEIVRYGTGTGASATDRQVNISAGTIIEADIVESWSAITTGITVNHTYRRADGKFARDGLASKSFPMKYNLNGVPTNLVNGEFGVFRLFVIKSNLNSNPPQFISEMHTAKFGNLNAARTAIANGSISNYGAFDNELAQVGFVTVTMTGTGGYVAEVTVAKTTFRTVQGGGTPTTQASGIVTSPSNFDKVLSASDTTVQAALETIDENAVSVDKAQTITGAKTFTAHPISSENTTPSGNQLLPVSRVGQVIAAATNKVTLSDGDTFALSDSADSGNLKDITWAQTRQNIRRSLTETFAPGFNFVLNPDAEGSLTDNITLGAGIVAPTSAPSPIRGTASFRLTGAATAGATTWWQWTLSTISSFFAGRPLSFSARTSASVASAFKASIWNVTDNTEVTESIVTIAGGSYEVKGFFIPIAGKTYALRITQLTNGTNTCDVDDVYVGDASVNYTQAMTDWQSFTPTFTNALGLNTGAGYEPPTGYWRRVGDSAQFLIEFRCSTAGDATGTGDFGFILPNNLVAAYDRRYANAMALVDNSASNARIVFNGRTVNALNRVNVVFEPEASGGRFQVGGIDAGDFVVIDVTIPIAGWSSNVQLGDKALVEYASNTNSTNASSDTTSFYNGIDGSLIPNGAVGTQYSRTIRFQNARQLGDKIEVEVNDGNGFVPIEPRIGPWILNATTSYGLRITWNNSTDMTVLFESGGYAPGGATYGSNGSPWSSLSSWRWRVRKVSPGRPALPLSTANVIGRTDGNLQAAGFIGETVTASCTNVTATFGGASPVIASISLNSGVWFITSECPAFNNVLGPAGTAHAAGCELFNSTTGLTITSTPFLGLARGTPTIGDSGYVKLSNIATIVVPPNTTHIIQFRALCTGVSGTPTGATVVTRPNGQMIAIRIA